MKPGQMEGPDGYVRTLQSEHDLNHAVARLFSSAEGLLVLAYLKSITTERVCGPEVTENHLFYFEGMRNIVRILAKRKQLGEGDLPHVPAKAPTDGDRAGVRTGTADE